MHNSADMDEEGMVEENELRRAQEIADEDDELFGPDLNREAVWAKLQEQGELREREER